jgi:hypothetical protein
VLPPAATMMADDGGAWVLAALGGIGDAGVPR